MGVGQDSIINLPNENAEDQEMIEITAQDGDGQSNRFLNSVQRDSTA
jgi:hypothetical protein